MIHLSIRVEEIDNEGCPTGRELHKGYTLPHKPEIGESIRLGGNQYEVFDVVHDLDSDPPRIEIRSFWPQPDFEMLGRDISWIYLGREPSGRTD